MIAKTQTHGERPDVTKALGLAFGSDQNVSFSVEIAWFGTRSCKRFPHKVFAYGKIASDGSEDV